MQTPPRDIATTLVEESFPSCQVALLAGSVVRGESHPGSDLDLVIIDPQAIPHWETRVEQGWPVELFVLTPATVAGAFSLDVRRRWPLHLTLCREGQALRDHKGMAAEIRATADRVYAEGPAALTAEEIEQKRYDLTWRLDDFSDATANEERTLIGHDVLLEAADSYLVFHQYWRGRGGKWMLRMLAQADLQMAHDLSQAFIALHEQHNPQPTATFGQRVLDELGGRLFANQYDAYQF